MTDVKRNVVNGVNTIVMHGKNYVEVCERVRLVHDQKREFEVLESSPLMVGDRCLWRMVIKVDGRLYTGNAEVKLNARAGTPDATNPFECGETSALGRALAFAGFGSVESIASFDEVYRATTDAQPQKPSEKPVTAPISPPTSNHPTSSTQTPSEVPLEVEKLLAEVKQSLYTHYQFKPEDQEPKWKTFKVHVLGLPVEDIGLSLPELKRLRDAVKMKIQNAKGAA